ncbi:unnamed protein product [Caenorhabditis nigoni]
MERTLSQDSTPSEGLATPNPEKTAAENRAIAEYETMIAARNVEAAAHRIMNPIVDDGLNQYGLPRKGPKTPEGTPPETPPLKTLAKAPVFDDVSDDSTEAPPIVPPPPINRKRQGPGTPLEPHPDDIAAMAAEEAQRNAALRIPISEGELSGDDSDSTVPPTTTTSGKPIHKKRKHRTSPGKTTHISPTKLRNTLYSPLRALHRQHVHVQPRKCRSSEERKPVPKVDNSKELTFPALAKQKCLQLLEFTEKKGLTITDEELYEVVREGIALDQALEKICDKKQFMKEHMEEMHELEYERIKKIHGNLPRHMQDVLIFENGTVRIAEDRAAAPAGQPMPYGTSTLMSLKYGQPPQHMGVPPPGYPQTFVGPPPPIGMPPPSIGVPPPVLGASSFAVPPPVSLLGPPPFSIPVPPPAINTSVSVNVPPPIIQPMAPPPSIVSENEKRNMVTHGLNPMAFSNPPPAGFDQATAKNSALSQNPQIARVTNNLSNMLTNALKAQVSKTQNTFGSGSPTTTPAKKAVPSLMSINIPGVPKSGSSSSKNQ